MVDANGEQPLPAKFEDFVAATGLIQTQQELFANLADVLVSYGYDKFNFCIFNDPALPAFCHQYGVYIHDAADWKAYYE